jgi:hypothetical protein
LIECKMQNAKCKMQMSNVGIGVISYSDDN